MSPLGHPPDSMAAVTRVLMIDARAPRATTTAPRNPSPLGSTATISCPSPSSVNPSGISTDRSVTQSSMRRMTEPDSENKQSDCASAASGVTRQAANARAPARGNVMLFQRAADIIGFDLVLVEIRNDGYPSPPVVTEVCPTTGELRQDADLRGCCHMHDTPAEHVGHDDTAVAIRLDPIDATHGFAGEPNAFLRPEIEGVQPATRATAASGPSPASPARGSDCTENQPASVYEESIALFDQLGAFDEHGGLTFANNVNAGADRINDVDRAVRRRRQVVEELRSGDWHSRRDRAAGDFDADDLVDVGDPQRAAGPPDSLRAVQS